MRTGLRLSPYGVPITVANVWQLSEDVWFERRVGKKEEDHLQFRLTKERREYINQLVTTDGVESTTQVNAKKLNALRFYTEPTVSKDNTCCAVPTSESKLKRRQVLVEFC